MQDQIPPQDDFLQSVPHSRRDFIKRMATVAFAVPVVGAFSMDSVALASPAHSLGNQTMPNQTRPPRHDDKDGHGRGKDKDKRKGKRRKDKYNKKRKKEYDNRSKH